MTAPPVALAPARVRIEPVAAVEVADRLVELAQEGPSGREPDLAGPDVLGADRLVRAWLDAAGRTEPVLHPRPPGAVGQAYRSGADLARPDAHRGVVRWAPLRARASGV